MQKCKSAFFGALGDDGGGETDSLDGVAFRRIGGASASVIFHCTIKSRRWQAVIEEVDKECSDFCITVDTVTRTAGILIHSRGAGCLFELAMWPSLVVCWLNLL